MSGIVAVAEILFHPLLEAAAAFALRDVDEIMQNQFPIGPGIGADNERVAEAYATCVVRDYAGAPRGLRQLGVVRQRDTIDDQHFYPRTILDAGETGIGDVSWT